MFILAVDTASGKESAAVINYGKVVALSKSEKQGEQAEKLLDHINKVMHQAKLDFDEIDYYAVNLGPGSFTGIRIGLSAILGICQAENKPLIGVSSLEALAFSLFNKYKINNISVAIDAGKDDAYYQEFIFPDDVMKIKNEAELISISRILTANIGNIKECRVQSIADAEDIGQTAFHMIINNIADFSRREPIYIRKPDAEVKLTENS